MSRSFINKGQDQTGQLEGISLGIAMSKYEDYPLKNNKIQKKQQKQAKKAKIQVFDLECHGL